MAARTNIIQLIVSLALLNLSTKLCQEINTDGNDFTRADFPDTLSRKCYIDKSLLIKEILHDKSNVILVTAPMWFFKTVNIDMVKRFLEIEVDAKGFENHNKTSTLNYRLFKNLKIFKNHRELFDQHFGKYPVVHIDYSILNEMNSYEDMVQRFRAVLVKTFTQHKYLMGTEYLWLTEVSKILSFDKYMDAELNKNLSMHTIQQGFEFLCTLLHSHFQKRVIVLIDEYDAFISSLIFRSVKYTEDIVNFMQSVNSHLFELSSEGIVKIFFSGALRLADSTFLINSSVSRDYLFLRDHNYSLYYGITGEELNELLPKYVGNKLTEINKIKFLISNYYGGYKIVRQNQELINPYSLLSYLNSNIIESYWPSRQNKEFFTRLFYDTEIKEGIIHLLQNKTYTIDISSYLLKEDILLLKNAVEGATYKATGNLSQVFFKLILELGYLAMKHKTKSNKNTMAVLLPNSEIEDYFASHLLDLIYEKYDISSTCIESLTNITSAFSVYNNSEDMFIELHERFCSIFCRSSYTIESERDFQSDLFSIFRYKFRQTYTNVEKEPIGRIDVLLRSENNVWFIIEINMKGTENFRNCTRAGVDKMIRKGYVNILRPEFQKSVVYLGLCYSKEDRKFGLGYAKSLGQGDDLNKIAYILLSD